MSQAPGYNPIKWDCGHNGCWNIACRPPLEHFAAAFPRKIGMTDLDATVELNGHFLFLEWKSNGGQLTFGQRTYFLRLSMLSKRITIVVVQAVRSAVDVERIAVIHEGQIHEWQPCTFQQLYDRVSAWAKKVDLKAVA